jgi:hypothetical protein
MLESPCREPGNSENKNQTTVSRTMKKTWSVLMVAGFCAASSQMASATSITPTYDSIGAIPAATFNGTTTSSGIPNSDVARATYTDANGDKVHIGLEAFGRYSNPVIGPNVGGTYSATAGFNNGLDGASPAHTDGPTWDFGWYLQVVTGSADITMRISDNTTGVSKDISFGTVGIGQYSDAWNLSMGFLTGIGFDPYANGNYGIQLGVLNPDHRFTGVSDAINVNVTGGTNVPDGGQTAGLLVAGLGGLAFMAKRVKKMKHVGSVAAAS